MPLLQNLPGKTSANVNISHSSKTTIPPLGDLEFDIKAPKRRPYRCSFLYSETLENWIITASNPVDKFTLNDIRSNEVVLALLLTTGLDVNTSTIKINFTQNKLVKYSQQLQESLYYCLLEQFDSFLDYEFASSGDHEAMINLCKVVQYWTVFKAKLVAMSSAVPIMDLVSTMETKIKEINKSNLTFEEFTKKVDAIKL